MLYWSGVGFSVTSDVLCVCCVDAAHGVEVSWLFRFAYRGGGKKGIYYMGITQGFSSFIPYLESQLPMIIGNFALISYDFGLK